MTESEEPSPDSECRYSLFVHTGGLGLELFTRWTGKSSVELEKRRPSLVLATLQDRPGSSFSDLRDSSSPFEIRKGGIVVPRHLWNLALRKKGVYRSVEYRVLSLNLCMPGEPLRRIDSTFELPQNASLKNVTVELWPINRLRSRYERDWPVTVNAAEAKLFSYKLDLFTCLLITVLLSFSSIMFAFVVPAYFLSLYHIPSSSMSPTLLPGDNILVEKVSLRERQPQRGEIILFRPPDTLTKMVRDRGTRLRHGDLFVKRVAAIAGDRLRVQDGWVMINGNRVEKAAGAKLKGEYIIPEDYVYVLGDNESHSIDSRYWGLLPIDLVEGTPVGTIWPLDRIGWTRSF